MTSCLIREVVARGYLPARLWIWAVLLSCLSASASANNVDQEILERITAANQSLRDVERTVGEASKRWQTALAEKENQVKSLRKQAAVLQRAADEQILGVEELERRVEQWSVQSKYQRHMLAGFIDNVNLPDVTVTDDGAKLVDKAILGLAHERIQSILAPRWEHGEVITPSGEIQRVQTLAVGPVDVALHPESGLGGLIDRTTAGEARLSGVLDGAALTEMQSLLQHGQGHLTFDPTLGNAAKLHGNEAGLWSHLQAGGVWAIPIVFFGLLAFVISLMKAVQLARLPKVRTHTWIENEGGAPIELDHKKSNRPVGKLQRRLLEIAKTVPVSPQRDDLLVACLMENRHRLERYMGAIATTAAVAPLLGLLGTVSGMISTFKMMTIFGSGDASTVSGGISEALVTTELGLIVAIPSLIVSALLSRKIKSYHQKLETFAVRLSKVPSGS